MTKPNWETTSVQNLLRNRSGRYYGRWTIGGKQKWVNLKTDVFGVAKLRLLDEAGKIEATRASGAAVSAGKGTMADLMHVYEERTKANPDLKPGSITARQVALKKLRKTWTGIESLKPSQVSPSAVADWATRFKNEGTNFIPRGAKTAIKGNSATSVNRAVDTLRRLMDIAIERGAIHTNPCAVKSADVRLKKKVTPTKITVPSVGDVHRLFDAIVKSGARGGWGTEAADFCRFLAYSGARVAEAAGMSWECIDWEKRLVHIRGQKSETSDRLVPLFPDLEKLLRGVQERRRKAAVFAVDGKPEIAAKDRIFRLSECQKSIDAACARIGIERVTHHDFRHLFATRCIGSDVDIPTVSRWLGHSDGGALAMRTYGHLRQEHSQSQALKVNFGGAA